MTVLTQLAWRRRALFCLVLFAAALATAAGAIAADDEPRCLGAASRDPEVPCHNAALAHMVTPRPKEAPMIPNSPCTAGEAPVTCTYGSEDADAEVALIGDSHAAHWRPAVQVAAGTLGWHVTEFAPAYCAFTAAVATGTYAAHCPAYSRSILKWLRGHPDVHTILVSALNHEKIVVPRGADKFETQVRGFVRQWKRLPRSVTRIVVLRDGPEEMRSTPGCVNRAIAADRPAGPACRYSRAERLERDPQAVAARKTSRRANVLDFNHQLCGPRWCYPVVGGVLAHRDGDHMTRKFAETLGPILTRRLADLIGYDLPLAST